MLVTWELGQFQASDEKSSTGAVPSPVQVECKLSRCIDRFNLQPSGESSWIAQYVPVTCFPLAISKQVGARMSLRQWRRNAELAEISRPAPVPDLRHIFEMLPNVVVVLV
jgi:hypothetical protein